MKLGTRLISAFILVSAISAAVSGIGLRNMAQISANADKTYRQDLVGLNLIQQANADVLRVGTYLRNAVLATTAEQRAGSLDQADKALAQAREHLNQAEPLVYTDKGKATFAELDQNWQDYIQAFNEMKGKISSAALQDRDGLTEYMLGEYHRKGFRTLVLMGNLVALKQGDAQSITTTAVAQGDELVINGVKHYISGAPFADFAIVMCVTDAAANPPAITAVLIDLDLPGVTVEQRYVPMSGQHIDADIRFDNVCVPRTNVFGGEGNGFRLGMSRINVNRLLHCPTMLGLATSAYLASLDYARERRQFGGPIARFQAIQHMLADMAASLWACESMIAQTAMLADAGADLRMMGAACKLFISERSFEVADKAVQIHGNVGVTRHHPIEQTFRKLRMFRVFTGTSEIQRNTIARAILEPAQAGR
ncbi:acyl-CoA dehydrogenase family protein [Paraburkholderia guartelaensis]|nr:acyl-CoA dehydrogenase family protein [Paraburkholderia guartelaensis]